MIDLDSICSEHPKTIVLAIDMNPDSEGESSGGFEIRPQGNGDLPPPIQFLLITNPSELIGLYDIETTPLISVLDRDKRIVAKKIQAKQIELIVRSVE